MASLSREYSMRTPYRAPSPKLASICSPRWPVFTTTSFRPARASRSKRCSMSVVPPTRSKGFGVTSVSGRMRSPRPAARIIAFTRLLPRHSYAFSLLLAQHLGLHRLARRPPVINHLADLLGDGHLHAVARREPLHLARGVHALRDLLHCGAGLRECPAAREREAHAAVA